MSTSNQERAFEFVRDHLEGAGIAPTIAEVAEHLGVEPSTARSIVAALTRQNRVVKTSARARNLAIAGEFDLTSIGTEAMRAELARRGVSFDALDTPRLFGGRSCAARGCISSVRPGMLMCRPHWLALPKHRRDTIMAAWPARHVQAYRDAVAAAIDFLDGYEWPSSQQAVG